MILRVLLILVCVAAVAGQRRGRGRGRGGGRSCGYRDDSLSPFYWKGYENICTKSICDTYPHLKCNTARQYIEDQASGHWPEDIHMEIEYLEKYFNTLIPKPNNQLPYHCTGVCSKNSKQLQLERIFTDLTLNKTGIKVTDRYMCIVIGPNIYYQQCGGNCRMPYGGGDGSFCVPDVTVTIDIWVYCPGASPGCHKVPFDVPLSCSCKKMRCRKDLPPPKQFDPIIPKDPKKTKTPNPGMPIDPKGLPLGPADHLFDIGGPGPWDPWGSDFGPSGPAGIDLPLGLNPMGGAPVDHNHSGKK